MHPYCLDVAPTPIELLFQEGEDSCQVSFLVLDVKSIEDQLEVV